MKKAIFVLVLVAIVMATGTAYARLVTVVKESKPHTDTSVVDLRDKDTTKPVKLLR